MESLRLTPLPAPPGLQAWRRPADSKSAAGSHLPASPLSQQGFCWGAVVSRPAVSSSFSFSWASIFFPFLPTFMNIYRCSSAIFLYPLNLGSAVCGTSGRGFHHYNLEVSLCNTPIVFYFCHVLDSRRRAHVPGSHETRAASHGLVFLSA